jgi:hypothetical protein|tara:strand:- start:403 stop:585 length:183 start_codon:yes stop_codon:yes gene_type:complete
MGNGLIMFKLLGLLLMPLSLAIKLIKLPLTIAGFITKLACLSVVIGILAVIIALIIYLGD